MYSLTFLSRNQYLPKVGYLEGILLGMHSKYLVVTILVPKDKA